MNEHEIQNDIRLYLGLFPDVRIFRANVGQAWTGGYIKLPGGDIRITTPRPFNTGLPAGWPDLFGFRVITVTQDMVGTQLPVFAAIEVKAPGGYVRAAQRRTLDVLLGCGCYAGVARSTDDAARILRIAP